MLIERFSSCRMHPFVASLYTVVAHISLSINGCVLIVVSGWAELDSSSKKYTYAYHTTYILRIWDEVYEHENTHRRGGASEPESVSRSPVASNLVHQHIHFTYMYFKYDYGRAYICVHAVYKEDDDDAQYICWWICALSRFKRENYSLWFIWLVYYIRWILLVLCSA